MNDEQPTQEQQPKKSLISDKPFKQQMSTILSTKLREAPAEPKVEQKTEDVEDQEEELKPIDPVIDNTFFPDVEDEEFQTISDLPAKNVQEYISQNIQPIQVTGYVGDEVRTFSIYTEDGLPPNFKFDSDISRLKTERALARIEDKAKELQAEFIRNEEQKKQAEATKKFLEQEEKDAYDDLQWLQSRGIIPQFRYKQDDSRFNSDPAVKEVDEIYDLFKKINAEYAQRYAGTGRMYRISFREATDKYYANKYHAARKPAEKTATEQERDNMARRGRVSQGGDAKTSKGRYQVRSFNDINRLIKQGKI